MPINALMVKELRAISGAGVMDCKKALIECNGNIDSAVDFLRKIGVMKAEKKINRIATEGIVFTVVNCDHSKASIVEVNSETDFVAKNEKFCKFVSDIANQIIVSSVYNIDELLIEKSIIDPSKTISEVLIEKIATIGEKILIRRFEKIVTNGYVVSYIHGNGRIGVLIEADIDIPCNDNIEKCLKNIAMQVAAMNPKYVSREDVPIEYIEHEKEILMDQVKSDAKNASKSNQIIEKMIVGRLNKELKEVCLLDQIYVKDSNMTVAQYISNIIELTGISFSIKRFIRYECGEGIEKRQENFAEEVAKQINLK